MSDNLHPTVSPDRRRFLKTVAAGATAMALGSVAEAADQLPGERPTQDASVKVLNPRARVPVSFIIDDSTCLVNLGHFCMPQFAEAWPDRADYKKDWRKLPREIPDAFVRKFAEFCEDHQIKGKYSIVPYPACVGWLDRDLPGWSHQELLDSLDLVRTMMLPNWDIHPEMITHTWAINTKTGRPYDERTDRFMENWRFTDGKSVDELADYLAYALRILKNVGLPCEGITTPGGFGGRVKGELSQAVGQAVRDVFRAELPHYFKYVASGQENLQPRIENASGLDGDNPRCVVNVYAGTGDWFGGWDGLTPGKTDQFITGDLQQGRMVEMIERGGPAIMLAHWAGVYFNGEEIGFRIFQEVVRRIHLKYDNLLWMKISEIARYWAAKELTRIGRSGTAVTFSAPYACPAFTVRFAAPAGAAPKLVAGEKTATFSDVAKPLALRSGTWTRDGEDLVVCFDLPKGKSQLVV